MSARSAYRPKSPAPEEPAPGSVPFSVQLLAFLAGVLILLLAGKSAVQDFGLARKLADPERYYEMVPATWIKLGVRRDASGEAAFHPDVLFDMNVRGNSVWGWRLSLEEAPRDSQYWVERLSGYSAGDTVTAYVNPRDSSDSFVEPRSDGSSYRIRLRGVMGAAFCLFGGTLVVLAVAGWVKAGAKKARKERKR